MITFTALAAMSLAVGVLLHWKKVGKKFVPWLMLVAGFGVAGMVESVLDRAAGAATSGTSTAMARLLGTAVPMGLAVLVSVYLWIHMKPKGQPPTKATPWIALAYGSIMFAAGGLATGFATFGETTLSDLTAGGWAFLTDFVAGFSG